MFGEPREGGKHARCDDERDKIEDLNDADGRGINTNFRRGPHPADNENIGIGEKDTEGASYGERPRSLQNSPHAF